MNICLKNKMFSIISDIVSGKNLPCFVIGGYVRDILLKRDSKDIDIVVLGSGIELAKEVARRIGRGTNVNIFRNFGTAMLRYKNLEIEFVGARKESYRRDSRKPVVENGTLEDDQKRRDFTINTLAVSLNKATYGELVDPFNGLNDLKHKIIRTPLDPDLTYSDDPLRMMRAIRFASQLNFNIEEQSLESITRNRERITIISWERITDELNKIMEVRTPSRGFRLLDKTGLLPLLLPELSAMKGVEEKDGKGHKDNFHHSLKVLDNLAAKSDNLWLRWAALLHDIGKPATKKYSDEQGWTFYGHDFIGSKMIPVLFNRLRLPMGLPMKYVRKLVMLHLRPIALAQEEVTDSAVRRLLFEAGDDIDDLMNLCESDITSKNDVKVKRYLNNFKLVRQKLIEIEEKDKIRNFQPPIDGELIMKTFNLKPCREVGMIKKTIKDAILDGVIGNNYQEAYKLMLDKAAEMGLKIKKTRV
ncbi:MAG: HD domain-containing protein [Bacteroidales bacterium]|nr:HD domain-containing protein [Bacteroidales bacterium]